MTGNRRILRGCIRTAAGEQDLVWNGHEPYMELFFRNTPRRPARTPVEALAFPWFLTLRQQPSLRNVLPSQLALEKDLLQPLRDAQRSGEILDTGGPLSTAPSRYLSANMKPNASHKYCPAG